MKHVMNEETATTLTNVEQADVQPNAVDLRVDRIFTMSPKAMVLSETEKKHRGSTELQPNADGWWTLTPGSYEVVMKNVISVGENEAGWVVTRSTLIRNGIFITSGLYDSGYNGAMAAAMHINAPLVIQRGTRVGQYLCFSADMLHKYDGSYGLEADGKPKTEEQKYHIQNDTAEIKDAEPVAEAATASTKPAAEAATTADSKPAAEAATASAKRKSGTKKG